MDHAQPLHLPLLCNCPYSATALASAFTCSALAPPVRAACFGSCPKMPIIRTRPERSTASDTNVHNTNACCLLSDMTRCACPPALGDPCANYVAAPTATIHELMSARSSAVTNVKCDHTLRRPVSPAPSSEGPTGLAVWLGMGTCALWGLGLAVITEIIGPRLAASSKGA